jgi:hypothetical protein
LANTILPVPSSTVVVYYRYRSTDSTWYKNLVQMYSSTLYLVVAKYLQVQKLFATVLNFQMVGS